MTAYTGTIGRCRVCGKEFVKVPANKTVCSPECRKRVIADNALTYYHREGADSRRARTKEDKVPDIAFATPDPWTNLMMAVLAQAKTDGDERFLEEFGGLFASAILGKELWKITWLDV